MDLQNFYSLTRSGPLLGPVLDRSEFEGLNAILTEALAKNVSAARLAYMLATTYHETNGTMQPVKELGGVGYLTRMYDIKGARPTLARANGNIYAGDGVKFSGRGFVQLTWRANYAKVGKLLGIDLVNNPDLALTLPVAAKILVRGMLEGWFTGASLETLPIASAATVQQFISARRIINGKDKAEKIAGYALIFQHDLKASGLQ